MFALTRLLTFLPFGGIFRAIPLKAWLILILVSAIVVVGWRYKDRLIEIGMEEAYKVQLEQRIQELEQERAVQNTIATQIQQQLDESVKRATQYRHLIEKQFGSISKTGASDLTSPIVTETIDAIRATRSTNDADGSFIQQWKDTWNQ